jgi:hypothetical protein
MQNSCVAYTPEGHPCRNGVKQSFLEQFLGLKFRNQIWFCSDHATLTLEENSRRRENAMERWADLEQMRQQMARVRYDGWARIVR